MEGARRIEQRIIYSKISCLARKDFITRIHITNFSISDPGRETTHLLMARKNLLLLLYKKVSLFTKKTSDACSHDDGHLYLTCLQENLFCQEKKASGNSETRCEEDNNKRNKTKTLPDQRCDLLFTFELELVC